MEFGIGDGVLVVCTYLLGAAPFGYLIARAQGVDIRKLGSGNIGATNVGRVLGKRWGALCFALDVGKGFVPTLIVRLLHSEDAGVSLAAVLTGLAAIVGHNWPVYLGFRGGKGVATSCGVFLALFWQGVVIALAIWAVIVALTRYVSVGSMAAAVALPVYALAFQEHPLGREGIALTGFTALVAALTIFRHRANIARLLKGTENRIGTRRRR